MLNLKILKLIQDYKELNNKLSYLNNLSNLGYREKNKMRSIENKLNIIEDYLKNNLEEDNFKKIKDYGWNNFKLFQLENKIKQLEKDKREIKKIQSEIDNFEKIFFKESV